MGCTDNFFEKKRGWSILKDMIINSYLKPYIAKILTKKIPLYIVDCFAGKGKFADESSGSPVFIAEHIKSILNRDGYKEIHGIFIEKKYADDLRKNMSGYKNCHILDGSFEDNIEKLMSLKQNASAFFYIDPYGIKSLSFPIFERIKSKRFVSSEILINFNSFGFLREGCRLLKYRGLDVEDNNEQDCYEIDEGNTIEHMNTIANGDYWQTILQDFNDKKISMFQAEELFTNRYTHELRSVYKFVLNIPIKVKSNNLPKYQIIFGTNHPDGLVLMADQMNKAWKEILTNERSEQPVLFEYVFPDSSLSPDFSIDSAIMDIVRKDQPEIELKSAIVQLIQKYGISFSTKYLKESIKKLNGDKLILRWDPPNTPTGRPATAMDSKQYNVFLRIK